MRFRSRDRDLEFGSEFRQIFRVIRGAEAASGEVLVPDRDDGVVGLGPLHTSGRQGGVERRQLKLKGVAGGD